MVFNAEREGFPVAFLISTRETEATFKLFFQAIKARAGVIVSKTFMSDMAPAFWNAWRVVMTECEHRLFCAWHFDKSLQENTRKFIPGDSAAAAHVYKQLRTVMEELDVTTFEAELPILMQDLEADPVTNGFALFFKHQYVHCSRSWAYCYRAFCGVNTNMSTENFHKQLKHNYMLGKVAKRLDTAIETLLNLTYDKGFERIITLCKGKCTKKLSALRQRHLQSLSLELMTGEIGTGPEVVCYVRERYDGSIHCGADHGRVRMQFTV